MDYKELVKNQDFSSSSKIADWIWNATCAITDLLARAEAAEARAEKAERERDAAVDLIGWIYYEACVSVEYDVRQHLDWLKDKIEQWRKKKGE